MTKNAGQSWPRPRPLTLIFVDTEIEAQLKLAAQYPDDRVMKNFYLGRISALLWSAGYEWADSLTRAERLMKKAGLDV